MKIQSIDIFKVTLPFRFAFGHSLATRSSSQNVIVRVKLSDGTLGFGEGIPRAYVTGEEVDSAVDNLQNTYAPAFLNLDVSSPAQTLQQLKQAFCAFDLERKAQGATWCALELAILDAVSRAHGLAVAQWLGPVATDQIIYGAVVPFGGAKLLPPLLYFYKLYGFSTIKVKVGLDLEKDIERLSVVRKILGSRVTLRVDANCAWTVEQTMAAAERFKPFGVASFEQPIKADDVDGLAKLTACLEQEVVVDESLCTIEQAQMLAEAKACNAFNIRVSKVGGILACLKMSQIARAFGIKCHLGAQVGESGIISSAGRIVACIENNFENHEGCDNMFLLKKDLTQQNLTVGQGGIGCLMKGYGLGVDVLEDRLLSLGHLCAQTVPEAASVAGIIPG